MAVLSDAIRGVNLNAGDVEEALREMEQAGAAFVTLKAISQHVGVSLREAALTCRSR